MKHPLLAIPGMWKGVWSGVMEVCGEDHAAVTPTVMDLNAGSNLLTAYPNWPITTYPIKPITAPITPTPGDILKLSKKHAVRFI